MSNQQIFNVELEPVKMTPVLKKHFKTISKWALFVGIFGALGLICSLFLTIILAYRTMDDFFYRYNGLTPLIISFVVSTITFFAVFFHLKFALKMQNALKWDNQDAFDSAWASLLNYFRFLGIWAIIMLMLTASFLNSLS